MGREERFQWKAGDIKVKFSQCSDCEKNVGEYECKAFGKKPDKYINNKFECPEKVTKTK